jgi:ATP-binding cassette subfamily B protein
MTKVSIVITGVINSALILFNSFFLIIIIVITMAVISVETTLLLFCFFAVVYYLIAYLVKKRLKINSGRIAQSQTSVAKIIQESRGAARDIILDNLQSYTLMQYVKHDKNWRRAAVSNIFIAGTPRYLFETLALLAIVGVVLFSLEREIDLLSIIPLLGTIVIVAQRLLPVAQQAYNAWVQMRGSHGALSDVVDILSKENNQEVTNHSNTGLKFTKDIELKNIEFSYDSGIRILNGINVNILKGEVIGIVGITGSGKSTLVDLIMGLIKPTKGDVAIDGVPLSENKYSGWYNMISHVPQEIFLSDATIKENIAYGKNISDIDIERVKDTLKLVHLYEFIESLPDQLNTIIGERGVRLSGGQKQRLGIARALYKDANLLVIDEGTSALDVETEKRVLQNIHHTCEELTVIMIAHRLETLKNCDRILVVDHGKVEKIINSPDIKSFCEAS